VDLGLYPSTKKTLRDLKKVAHHTHTCIKNVTVFLSKEIQQNVGDELMVCFEK
jgi:hypothetical protein